MTKPFSPAVKVKMVERLSGKDAVSAEQLAREHNQPAVLSVLGLRIRTGLTRLVVKTKRLLHEAIRPLPAFVGLVRDLTRSREQLIAENALLRQQLFVARPRKSNARSSSPTNVV